MTDLNIPSMHDDDLTAIMLRCASVLNARREWNTVSLSEAVTNAFEGYCWTKAGDDPIVTLNKDGRVMGHLPSKEIAKKYNIPNCGVGT